MESRRGGPLLRRSNFCLTQRGSQFGDHLCERDDVEDSLTTTQQVNEFAVVVREYGPRVRQHETARREIDPEGATKTFDGLARASERDTRAEKRFDDLDFEDVAVGVRALRATARSAVSYTHLRAHETGRNLVCRLL